MQKILIMTHTHTQTHTTVLRPVFRDYPGEPVPEETFFWTFTVQGKITQADTLTIRMGAIPSKLISDPSLSSPHFYTGCPSCRNPHTLSWLGTGTKYAGWHNQWHGFIVTLNVILKVNIHTCIFINYFFCDIALPSAFMWDISSC